MWSPTFTEPKHYYKSYSPKGRSLIAPTRSPRDAVLCPKQQSSLAEIRKGALLFYNYSASMRCAQ